jgi:hypothetical protein
VLVLGKIKIIEIVLLAISALFTAGLSIIKSLKHFKKLNVTAA